MHITYKIVRVTVQPVIVIIPALIRTEFFIGTTTERIATIETFLFHSTNVLIKIHKIQIMLYKIDLDIQKRFQTDTNDYK